MFQVAIECSCQKSGLELSHRTKANMDSPTEISRNRYCQRCTLLVAKAGAFCVPKMHLTRMLSFMDASDCTSLLESFVLSTGPSPFRNSNRFQFPILSHATAVRCCLAAQVKGKSTRFQSTIWLLCFCQITFLFWSYATGERSLNCWNSG